MWVYDPIHMNYCGSLNQKASILSLKYPVHLLEGKSIKRQHPLKERVSVAVHRWCPLLEQEKTAQRRWWRRVRDTVS